MIAPVKQQSDWQTRFLTLLPELQRRLRRQFRLLDPASRDEAIAEAMALCVVAFVRLNERGRTHVANASTLAFYSSRQVKRGRTAAGRMNGKEPLSRYAQVGQGVRVENDQWIDLLVEDKRASVPDQVAARIDVRAWFKTLPQRLKQIATDLAHGLSTSEVAKKYGLSPGRISQLRRELLDAWRAFQGEPALV